MIEIGTVACEHCNTPVTVVAFDLLPSRRGQTTYCHRCKKATSLPFLAGVIGFFLGMVAAIYSGRAVWSQAEDLFGAPLGVVMFLLVFLVPFAVCALVTILVTKALYRIT